MPQWISRAECAVALGKTKKLTDEDAALLESLIAPSTKIVENWLGYAVLEDIHTELLPDIDPMGLQRDTLIDNFELSGNRAVSFWARDTARDRRILTTTHVPVRYVLSIYESQDAWQTAGGSFPANTLLVEGADYQVDFNQVDLVPPNVSTTAPSIAGATSITVNASAGIVPGQAVLLNDSAAYEIANVRAVPDGVTLTVWPLLYDHASGIGLRYVGFGPKGFQFRRFGSWTVLERAVKITYLSGYSPAELSNSGRFPEFRLACLQTIVMNFNQMQAHMPDRASRGGILGAITSESLDGYSASVSKSTDDLYGFVSDIPLSAKRILQRFRRYAQNLY